MKQNSPQSLPPFDPDEQTVNVIIETPKGSRNKYKWDEQHQLYQLSNVLSEGLYFPYDFGFIPNTLGGDGDPLDVLLFMDEPVFSGCLAPSRVIGILEAEQDKNERNDRIIAVSTESHDHKDVHSIADLSDEMMCELEQFFEVYHRTQGKKFKVIDRKGPKAALKVIKAGEKAAAQKHKKAS